MGNKIFLDTNLFLYAQDRRFPDKQRRSREAITEVRNAESGVVSTQIMQELFSVGISKFSMLPAAAKALVHTLTVFEVVQVTPMIIEAAMDCVILRGLSIWDALVVAAAAAAGCGRIYSEDMQSGATILGVRVENPLA